MEESIKIDEPATVRIPLEKYQKFLKASYHLKLLNEWASLTDEAFPFVIECSHPGCEAVQVTDQKQYSHTLEKNCQTMTMCAYQDVCHKPEGGDVYFCNHHAAEHLVDYEENLKTGESIFICTECRDYQDKKKKLQDYDWSQEKDIDLVISQTRCSKLQAIEALLKNEGDIVFAIMTLQS